MIRQLAVRGVDKNFSYFIVDDSSRAIAVIDPGDYHFLKHEIDVGSFVPKMILLTHSHFDHVEAVSGFVKDYEIDVYLHRNADFRVAGGGKRCFVEEGSVIRLGDLLIDVIYTPGHIDDAVCYLLRNDPDGKVKLFTGDTVFVGACGRADLDGSNVEDLFNSLQKIRLFPDDVEIYPGHDYGNTPSSTIGIEKENNRYLKCDTLNEFISKRF